MEMHLFKPSLKHVWSVLPQACFDCRPRRISKRWKENHALCANVPTSHQFDKKKYVRNTAHSLSHVNKDVTAEQSWIFWYKHAFFRLCQVLGSRGEEQRCQLQ